MVYVEGITSNGEGLLPFKKDAFDIGAPVKLTNIKYESTYFHPNMNFVTVADFFILCALQWRIKATFTEIEGNFKPKHFTNWEEFAEKTRNLMAETFNLKLAGGSIKDKIMYEKQVSKIKFKY